MIDSRRIMLEQITEKDFLADVRRVARLAGWETYHPWRSDHSEEGYPDLTLLKGERLVFAELKTEKGVVSPAQQRWLDLLSHVQGVEVYLWRPRERERIDKILGLPQVGELIPCLHEGCIGAIGADGVCCACGEKP